MPLLDHFRPPRSDGWPWDGIHSNWATKIVDLLNADCLPPDYHAISLIKRVQEVEDLFEVQIIQRFGGAQLRAAVELVSPGNKDRPASRRTFGVKCASYLCQGIAVVVIDVVTERLANLHAELMGLLQSNGEPPWQSPTNLSAVAYRVVGGNGVRQLESCARTAGGRRGVADAPALAGTRRVRAAAPGTEL